MITTEHRPNDWVAFVDDDRTRWESGRTEAEAVGKLCITFKNRIAVLEENAERIDEDAERSSRRHSEEIAAREATIDRWRTRATTAEAHLRVMRGFTEGDA
jgi:hypothetical protein